MNKFLKTAALAAAASFVVAGSANAAVTYTGATTGAPDPGPQAGETIMFDFSNATGLSGDYSLVSGSSGGVYEPPAQDASQYLVVPGVNSPSGTASLDLTTVLSGLAVDTFSFYWGSIDTYNSLRIYDTANNLLLQVLGSQLPPADGNPASGSSNVRVNFAVTGLDRTNLGRLEFTSNGKAFELDDVAFATSAVPEPATWAMMITGFGLAGAAIRRRRTILAVA